MNVKSNIAVSLLVVEETLHEKGFFLSTLSQETCLAFTAVAKGGILFVAVGQLCQAIHKSRTMSNVKI